MNINPIKIGESAVVNRINERNTINEEQLYSVLVSTSLSKVSKKTEEAFKLSFEQAKQNIKRSDGYVSIENATNIALNDLLSSKLITEEQLSSVKLQSFRAAQLDENLGALFDGRGSANDQTVAVSSVKDAIKKALDVIDKVIKGEIALTAITEGSHTSKAPDGFLWKPVSEKDGNLVVLLPTSFRGDVQSVQIINEENKVVEEGEFSGDTHNGNRPHFRFDKPGGLYGENITLKITLNTGKTTTYNINNGAERTG